MSSDQELHPSVQEFKQFMKQHPLLIQEVKGGSKTLQELFEEWSVVGSEHEQWSQYIGSQSTESKQTEVDNKSKDSKTSKSASDTLGQIIGLVKRMNVDDLQQHLTQFSSVLANVQNVIQSFQKPSNHTNQNQQDHPFSFRRD
ncbi:YlbD family protein [Alkalihalobacillus sp. MEB130]|uniref:YlbD family protein n=1 Tax=Alkalihalobacillus sp. MEB130 TaxID=2976704 RepID=UPI0028DE3688|nr:YlbD family protein [Alkalihalobacillus sp. MEB130]MDT8859153.1 YlbD family protein [Alkalihalobacillus sp. MEB130]